MGLEIIYIVRHGHRMYFTVDPSTGTYSTSRPTPTGIAADPELAKYGVDQSKELATKLLSLEPEVDVFYCSPFYRCLQTLKPTMQKLSQNGEHNRLVKIEPGVGEFFGAAPFAHPQPASLSTLEEHFDFIDSDHKPVIKPNVYGETIEELHDRIAYALHGIISELDAESNSPRVLVICTHAACMICMGRVLTGQMPEDSTTEDFRCGTCALSKYVRRPQTRDENAMPVKGWSPKEPNAIPHIDWANGNGVKGGWDCEWNGDCSFLSGGEERTWRFTGDESFLDLHDTRPSISRDGAQLDENESDQESQAENPVSQQSGASKL